MGSRVLITAGWYEIGPVDVVLFCVKLYDVETAAELIRPIVGPQTVIISVLNGIDGPGRLWKVLGIGYVFSGAARVSAKIKAPGVISYLGHAARHKLTIGHPTQNTHPTIKPFIAACHSAGFATELERHPENMNQRDSHET